VKELFALFVINFCFPCEIKKLLQCDVYFDKPAYIKSEEFQEKEKKKGISRTCPARNSRNSSNIVL
jgi:hypothetical protein